MLNIFVTTETRCYIWTAVFWLGSMVSVYTKESGVYEHCVYWRVGSRSVGL